MRLDPTDIGIIHGFIPRDKKKVRFLKKRSRKSVKHVNIRMILIKNK